MLLLAHLSHPRGGQPSVVRAVLMGATALLIRESDQRSRGTGVLLLTLILMLLVRPDWAHSIGFQLSAAATAGLTLSAPGLEQQLLRCCPSRMRWLASTFAVSLAALVWTLLLQLFISDPHRSTRSLPIFWPRPCWLPLPCRLWG